MAKKETGIDEKISWLEKPLNLLTILTGIGVTLFSVGMGVGIYKKELEEQVVVLKKDQECSERVQAEKEKCSEYRRSVQDDKVQSLEKTIESIKSIRKNNQAE